MTEPGVARKKFAPLLLALVLIAALVAITLWARKPDPAVQQADASATQASADDNDTAAGLPSAPARPSAGMSAAEVTETLKRNTERRNRLRDEQVTRTAAARQTAISTYRSEPVDPAWAPQQERKLDEIATSPAIAQTKIAPRELSVDCKSTTCLINGKFANSGEAEDWLLMYMSSVGSTLPTSIVTRTQNPDGTTSIEIYGRAR